MDKAVEKILIERIEKRLESCKQWKDDYGVEWVEVNGQKFPKKAMIQTCMKMELVEYERERNTDSLTDLANACPFL